jgi:hypothetical protein
LLCVSCRKLDAAAKRAVFARARRFTVSSAERRGLLRSNRRGGRWSEKFLTLTAPHWSDKSVAERIAIVLGAWPRLLRLLNDHWKAHGVKSAEWFRVVEWTPGSADDGGHPHLHVWLLSPFLPRDDIERWWRQALIEQTGVVVPHVIIDIREVDGLGVELELVKYLTKDILPNREKVAPEIYAEVYKALDDKRISQASKGFMARAKQEARRCECGSALPKRVERLRAPKKQAP